MLNLSLLITCTNARGGIWGFFWTFAGVSLDSLTTIKHSYYYTVSKQLPSKNEKKIGRQGTEKMQNILQACSQIPDDAGADPASLP